MRVAVVAIPIRAAVDAVAIKLSVIKMKKIIILLLVLASLYVVVPPMFGYASTILLKYSWYQSYLRFVNIFEYFVN